MRRFLVLTLVVTGIAIAGCGGSGPNPAETATSAMSAEEVEAAVSELLAKADRADESEDHVVEKCMGCGLAMAGSPDHALQVRGYELHLCSAACEKRVAEDIDEAILELGQLEEGPREI